MLPTSPDLVAIALQVGDFFLEIGPFIVFGAIAAAAQVTIFGRRSGPWSGERLIAPIAAVPLGIIYILTAALRSTLIYQTGVVERQDPAAAERGVLRRAMSYLDELIFPFLASAAIGAVIIVLTPTEPLWTLLSGPEPWRLVIAPLVAGAIKPRGGTELPLILAMTVKGLDPAGAIAGIAGAGYRHANSLPLAALHLAFGAGLGALLWLSGIA